MNPLFIGLGLVVLLCTPAAFLVESPDLRQDAAMAQAASVAERTVPTRSLEQRAAAAERLALARIEEEVLEPLRRSSLHTEHFSRVRLPVRAAYRQELVRPVDPGSGLVAFRIWEVDARVARAGVPNAERCVLEGEVMLADGRVRVYAGDQFRGDRRPFEALSHLLQPVEASQASTPAK